MFVISSRGKINFNYESDLIDPILDIELEPVQVISLLVYFKTDWINKMPFSPLFAIIKKEGIKI